MTTVYVVEQGAILAKKDERLLVRKEGKTLEELPFMKLQQIVIFGNAVMTTPLVAAVLDQNIPVSYLSQSGQYRGRLQPGWSKDAALRRSQHLKATDTGFSLLVSQAIVKGKLLNMQVFLRRQRQKQREVDQAVLSIEQIAKQADIASSLESLRGYEGAAGAAYYKALAKLMQPVVAGNLQFAGRSQHPPGDPVNALLSLGYTLLYQEMLAAISMVGFDPYCGFYHQLKYGHAALASDMIEEWRAMLVDSTVLTLLNRGEVKPGDFRKTPKGFQLTREGLARFLSGYEQRMMTLTQHPRLNSVDGRAEGRVSYRRCLELQVRQLADTVLGRAQNYRPFLIR